MDSHRTASPSSRPRGASILLRKRMARQLQQSYSQSFRPVARFPSNLNCRKSLARDSLARSSDAGSPMFHPRLQESSSSKIFCPAMSLASMEPLPQSSGPSSRMQKKGAPNKCKHGFPKKTNVLSRVICRGNARRFQVSAKGRRNALGLWLGAREDAWLSGTMTAFSVWLFGNSHTAVNYRVPLCPATHDPECQRNCLQQATAGKLQRLMQQASHPLLYGVPAKATTSRTERTPASRQATAFPPHQRWQRSDRGPLSQGGQSRVWRP